MGVMSTVCAGCWLGVLATSSVADAAAPLPASFEVTGPVVLFWVPAALAVTFTVNVQEALAARVAPVRLTLPDAAAAVIVPPPQVPVNPFGEAITSPAGSVSVKAMPIRDRLVFGLDN